MAKSSSLTLLLVAVGGVAVGYFAAQSFLKRPPRRTQWKCRMKLPVVQAASSMGWRP